MTDPCIISDLPESKPATEIAQVNLSGRIHHRLEPLVIDCESFLGSSHLKKQLRVGLILGNFEVAGSFQPFKLVKPAPLGKLIERFIADPD